MNQRRLNKKVRGAIVGVLKANDPKGWLNTFKSICWQMHNNVKNKKNYYIDCDCRYTVARTVSVLLDLNTEFYMEGLNTNNTDR